MHLFATTAPQQGLDLSKVAGVTEVTSRPSRRPEARLVAAQADMRALPRYPSLYQINARVWLTELAGARGRRATLETPCARSD
jgi:hypothetical protein